MESKTVNVTAFMTAPRYECTWARNYIEIALKRAGIPLKVSGGVFYAQCMQKMFEESIEEGCDVGITIDFDSVFTAEQLMRLLRHVVSNPEIDCVAAMQCRRGGKTPLATCGTVRSIDTDMTTPFQVTTAHFGLTAIDFAKLREVKKPWFFCSPDENGEYGDAKIDSDIWFWKQWREAGNTVYMDPGCQIGHLEEVVTSFEVVGDRFEAVHRYPNEWAKANGY